jgi:hypothetical protein
VSKLTPAAGSSSSTQPTRAISGDAVASGGKAAPVAGMLEARGMPGMLQNLLSARRAPQMKIADLIIRRSRPDLTKAQRRKFPTPVPI